jgi:transcriptional regulator with XRE-family HTH domain
MTVQAATFSGHRLNARRVAVGMRRENLAAALGCTYGIVARWEQGNTAPSAVYLMRLCAVLSCAVEDLFDTTSPVAVPA